MGGGGGGGGGGGVGWRWGKQTLGRKEKEASAVISRR